MKRKGVTELQSKRQSDFKVCHTQTRMQGQGGVVFVLDLANKRLKTVKDSLSKKKESLVILYVLHHAFHNNTTPQIQVQCTHPSWPRAECCMF